MCIGRKGFGTGRLVFCESTLGIHCIRMKSDISAEQSLQGAQSVRDIQGREAAGYAREIRSVRGRDVIRDQEHDRVDECTND
jgi:hypothetical protein